VIGERGDLLRVLFEDDATSAQGGGFYSTLATTRPMRLRTLPRALAACVLLGIAWLVLETQLEKSGLQPLPIGKARPPELSAETLRADLFALAAPEMEGRRATTPGGRRARAFIEQRFAALGLSPLDERGFARPFSFEHRSIEALYRRDRPYKTTIEGSANAVGVVRSARPEARVLLVSAHYDHEGVRNGVLYPGADDNASGVAVLLALAAWSRAHALSHTIVFAALDAEELGLRGAVALLADPGFPRARLDAVLNMDMVGRPDGGGLAIAGTAPQPELRPIVLEAASQAAIPVKLGHDKPRWRAGFVDDWTDASDQGPFVDAGFRWLYVGVEDHEDYHRPGDVPERVPSAYHAAVAELVLDLLRGLDRLR
jgi:Peptidase family M28